MKQHDIEIGKRVLEFIKLNLDRIPKDDGNQYGNNDLEIIVNKHRVENINQDVEFIHDEEAYEYFLENLLEKAVNEDTYKERI